MGRFVLIDDPVVDYYLGLGIETLPIPLPFAIQDGLKDKKNLEAAVQAMMTVQIKGRTTLSYSSFWDSP